MCLRETGADVVLGVTDNLVSLRETDAVAVGETGADVCLGETGADVGLRETDADMGLGGTGADVGLGETSFDVGLGETVADQGLGETGADVGLGETGVVPVGEMVLLCVCKRPVPLQLVRPVLLPVQSDQHCVSKDAVIQLLGQKWIRLLWKRAHFIRL